jgi:non-canonical (house-cleaning) NTP pyrophosphatase
MVIQAHTLNVHDTSSEWKTAENFAVHLENTIKVVRTEYFAVLVAVVTDASGECRKTRRILALKYPEIVFLDCYAHQVCALFASH